MKKGSVLEMAGVLVGDTVLRIGDDAPVGVDAAAHAFSAAPAGMLSIMLDRQTVVMVTKKKPSLSSDYAVRIRCAKPAPPGTLGATFASKSDVCVIGRLAEGSALEQAGACVGDKIAEINGKALTSAHQVSQSAVDSVGFVELIVLRGGGLDTALAQAVTDAELEGDTRI